MIDAQTFFPEKFLNDEVHIALPLVDDLLIVLENGSLFVHNLNFTRKMWGSHTAFLYILDPELFCSEHPWLDYHVLAVIEIMQATRVGVSSFRVAHHDDRARIQ